MEAETHASLDTGRLKQTSAHAPGFLFCPAVSGVWRGLGHGWHVRGPVRARAGRVQTLPLLRERQEGDRGTLERKTHHLEVQKGELLLLRAAGHPGLWGGVRALLLWGRPKKCDLTLPSAQQDTGEELSALDVVFYATLEVSPYFESNRPTSISWSSECLSPVMQVRNSLGLNEEEEYEEREGGNISTLAKLWGKKLKMRNTSYSRAELDSLWSLLQQEEYTFLR